jgi:hypothetical protein
MAATQLVDILGIPRAAADALLAEHGGSVEAAVQVGRSAGA